MATKKSATKKDEKKELQEVIQDVADVFTKKKRGMVITLMPNKKGVALRIKAHEVKKDYVRMLINELIDGVEPELVDVVNALKDAQDIAQLLVEKKSAVKKKK